MSSGISLSHRIIAGVREPIPSLHPLKRWNYGIRAGEPPNRRVIHARFVKHQPKPFRDPRSRWIVHVRELSREGVIRQFVGRRGGSARGPPRANFALAKHPRSETKGAWLVSHLRDFGSRVVSCDTGGTQVVTEAPG